jgi:hypothetical protein
LAGDGARVQLPIGDKVFSDESKNRGVDHKDPVIGGRTQHARRVIGAHPGYAAFMDYGDADGYRKWLEQLQKNGSSGQ